jgi:hypothetical protein
VATLVAEGVTSAEIFSAVSNEVGRLFGSDISTIVRFEPDATVAVLPDSARLLALGEGGEPIQGRLQSLLRSCSSALEASFVAQRGPVIGMRDTGA